MESHQSKLVGSRGSSSRYFDFEKLGEVHLFLTTTDTGFYLYFSV